MVTSDIAQPEQTANEGRCVLHLFFKAGQGDLHAVTQAVKQCQAAGAEVVSAAILGHKADLALMAYGPSFEPLRTLQSTLERSRLELGYSYVSLTELSEYAKNIPPSMREARLRPVLPPAGMPAFCFYPMSKRRDGEDNWYRLSFQQRLRLMYGHGATGRLFHGRVIQLITGSTGLDDYEWGVTLFAKSFEDIKECVYTMRYDEASSRYADFGPFLVGTVGEIEQVLDHLGWPM